VSRQGLTAYGDRSITDAPEGEAPAAALASYLRGIFRHRVLFPAIVLICFFSSLAWLLHRSPAYEAHAAILVAPIPAADQSLVGLPLVRATDQEPDRATGTAATLIQSPAAARLAASALHVSNPDAVQAAVSVQAKPRTSIVEITATGGSPSGAARVADAYGNAALRARSDLLISRVRPLILGTERNLASAPPGVISDALRTKLAELRSVAHRGDPTLSLAATATPGTLRDSPAPLVLILSLGAGLVLASLTIVLIELLAPRPIEDESELFAAYPLPVLSRVPAAALADDPRRPLAEAPQGLREGFRALRGQLELRATGRMRENGERGAVVLFVSPSPTDGRAVCSLNLARAFVSAGESVTVVELDLRNPRMAGMLATDPRHDIAGLVTGLPLERVASPLDGSNGLRLIAAPPAIDLATLEQVIARSAEIVDDSRRLSDWIVVDAPPISEAADALIAASSADHIVIVARLGSTTPGALAYLRELFEQAGRAPDGFLVVSATTRRPQRVKDGGVGARKRAI